MAMSTENIVVGTEFWAESESVALTETEKLLLELAKREADKPDTPAMIMEEIRSGW